MKGWAHLKDAFWAAVDREPAERARLIGELEAKDPALAKRLEALLAADQRGDVLEPLFESAPSIDTPDRIGEYEVIGALGAGGMGEVYRARDPRLQREVAIKILPPAVANNRERLARFEREAHALASLNHPHIAQVYGLIDSGGGPALVMELVPGPTLAAIIARGQEAPLTVRHALTIAGQIADGLDAAHDKGIVNRDLKPSNVALTEDTPGGQAKILDFGGEESSEQLFGVVGFA